MAFPILAFSAISAGLGVFSANSKKNSSNKEAALILDAANTQYVESLRDAELIKYNGNIFAQKQEMQYIGAGVILGGSALITLEQTRRFAAEEANAVVRRGAAGVKLAKQKQEIVGNEGNASLIGSLITGTTSVLSSAYGGGK